MKRINLYNRIIGSVFVLSLIGTIVDSVRMYGYHPNELFMYVPLVIGIVFVHFLGVLRDHKYIQYVRIFISVCLVFI